MLVSYQSGVNARGSSSYAMRRLSGEYDAVKARGSGSASSRPPSTETVHRRRYDDCGTVPRSDAKSTRLPSRVQPFTRSLCGWYVSRFGSPPAAETTYTSVLPLEVRLKATSDPSGEKCEIGRASCRERGER